MRWPLDQWDRFWFAPALPDNLGLCRLLFFGALLAYCLAHDFSAWAEVSRVFWAPVGVFEIFHLPHLPGPVVAALQTIWKLSLALACIGLWTRANTATAFVLGFYLLNLWSNFGRPHHQDPLLIFTLGILALSRCGDSWSVDRLLARRRGNAAGLLPAPNGEYTWPIRMVWLTMSLIFFSAGVTKSIRSGWEWVASDNLRIVLVQNQYHIAGSEPLTNWGLTLAQYPGLCRLLAGLPVVSEVAFPLAMFSRRVRWVVVPTAFLMLVGIRVLLGPNFTQMMIVFLFWIPWDRVLAKLANRSVGETPS
jgi:hypothetical protein